VCDDETNIGTICIDGELGKLVEVFKLCENEKFPEVD
jgi:hypothetical protein